MSTRVFGAPQFVTVRSESGAIAADSGTISDANYPLSKAFIAEGKSPDQSAGVYWYGAGGSVPGTDNLDLQILYRDPKLGTPAWIQGATQSGVTPYTLTTFDLMGFSGDLYIRVVAKVSAAGQDLRIRAAIVQL